MSTLNYYFEHRSSRAPLTAHAGQRLQQRGIPATVLQLLLDFAEPRHRRGDACHKYQFDSETWNEAQQHIANPAKYDRYRNIFAVVDADDQAVITVGWVH